jgi:hypothetical protein
MQYKVIPFYADIMKGEGETKAAQQLSDLINSNAKEGWTYVRLETLVTFVTTPATPGTPGKSGCFGFGEEPSVPGTPAVTNRKEVYVAVFSK